MQCSPWKWEGEGRGACVSVRACGSQVLWEKVRGAALIGKAELQPPAPPAPAPAPLPALPP